MDSLKDHPVFSSCFMGLEKSETRAENPDALAGDTMEKEIQKLRVRAWAEALIAVRSKYLRCIELISLPRHSHF